MKYLENIFIAIVRMSTALIFYLTINLKLTVIGVTQLWLKNTLIHEMAVILPPNSPNTIFRTNYLNLQSSIRFCIYKTLGFR